jgi:hypothetical protein
MTSNVRLLEAIMRTIIVILAVLASLGLSSLGAAARPVNDCEPTLFMTSAILGEPSSPPLSSTTAKAARAAGPTDARRITKPPRAEAIPAVRTKQPTER